MPAINTKTTFFSTKQQLTNYLSDHGLVVDWDRKVASTAKGIARGIVTKWGTDKDWAYTELPEVVINGHV